jgi:hypothetical protein
VEKLQLPLWPSAHQDASNQYERIMCLVSTRRSHGGSRAGGGARRQAATCRLEIAGVLDRWPNIPQTAPQVWKHRQRGVELHYLHRVMHHVGLSSGGTGAGGGLLSRGGGCWGCTAPARPILPAGQIGRRL